MARMRVAAALRRLQPLLPVALLWIAAASVAACGGGGGGDSPAPPAPAPAPPGGFTLSASTLSFSAKFLSAAPAPQSILLTLADSTSALVGAAYKPGIAPAGWLNITVTGTAPNYSFAFVANMTSLPAGTYTTTVTIGTSDASGNILQTRDVQVSYTVREGLAILSRPPVVSAVAGSPQAIRTFGLEVSAPASLQWTATASQPWLLPPAGALNGPGIYSFGVDASLLPPGQTSASLTLANTADPTDTAVLTVPLNVTAPALTTSVQEIRLGGESGFDSAPASLRFALATGTRAHPWTIAVSTTSGGDWLHASSVSGDVSATESVVAVTADRAGLAAGTYTGQIVLEATVNGAAISRTLPVTFNVEANRLVVSATGVAFSSFPSRSVLARTLVVRDTAGEADVAWQATSTQPWLSATSSGAAGQPLVLTANPTGLPIGQHLASVTIVSTTPRVGNTETVRVGLTVRASDPPAQADVPGVLVPWTAVSPVQPELFASVVANGDTSVAVYDVYSGALLRTLPGTEGAQSLALSGDGLALYVARDTPSGARVVQVDPVSGAVQRTFDLEQPLVAGATIAYVRPDSHPILLTSNRSFDAATAVPLGAVIDGGSIVASSDQRYVYTQNSGSSPSSLHRHELRYSTLAAAPLSWTTLTTTRDIGENGSDLALSADDATLFAANGYPYHFARLAPATLQPLGPPLPGTPYPNNVEACWNGLLAAGADASNEPAGDLWIYDALGTELPRRDSGTDALTRGALRFSGDCTRLVSASGSGLRFHMVP